MKCIDGGAVWMWHATHGVPLEISLPMLAQRGLVPTWDRLVHAAKADGANPKTLLRRLSAAVTDAYEREFARVVCSRLHEVF